MELLTFSRLRAYRACSRRHYYGYVMGRRARRVARAKRIGSILHAAVEAYWCARRDGADEEARWGAALAALVAALAALGPDFDPYEAARLRVLLGGYCLVWDLVPCEVLEVEREFKMPLLNPETGAASRSFRLGGKVDRIIRLLDEPGHPVVVGEVKSTSEHATPGSTYYERLQLDSQVSTYYDGAASLGYAPERVEYDVLCKIGLKPHLATPEEARRYRKDGALYASQRAEDEAVADYEARCAADVAARPGFYYQRIAVARPDAEQDEHRWDLWQLADLVRLSMRTGRAPRNPDACHAQYGTCEYWPTCSSRRVPIEDPHYYRDARAHEELGAPDGDAGEGAA